MLNLFLLRDTSMRVLRLEREPSDQRTGVFTSGIVATGAGRKIALYFTGRQHAGENLAEVLKQRAPELGAPIQMCDAASRNVPKLSEGVEILVANCLAHGRRQFVEVAQSFPQECRYVLEALGRVYYHDAQARQQDLSAQERLQFHQQHSAPVMEELHGWLQAQLAQKKTEPNSALGKAINYMLRHWSGLTVFLRQPGSPIDNNLCEQVLKRAVLHRLCRALHRRCWTKPLRGSNEDPAILWDSARILPVIPHVSPLRNHESLLAANSIPQRSFTNDISSPTHA